MPDTRETDTLILALGNPLRGDDGIGQAALAVLAERVPPGVALLDGGTSGLELILTMEGYRRVVILDAADMGRAPGTVARFTPDDVQFAPGDLHQRVTVHYAGLAEALALGDALGLLPDEIIIIGAQPECIDWYEGLSAPVAAAVETVAQMALTAVQSPG